MPKAKWGSDLTVDDIEGAEGANGTYTGPIPPSGVYLFDLKIMQQAKSKADNPKVFMVWEMAKTGGKKDQKKWAGAPLFDHMPVMKSAAFRAKAFCEALGVSYKDFLNNTVVEKDGDKINVIKIGKLVIDGKKIQAFINVKRENDEDNGERLVLSGGGYLPKPDESDDDSDADGDSDDDADDGDSPF